MHHLAVSPEYDATGIVLASWNWKDTSYRKYYRLFYTKKLSSAIDTACLLTDTVDYKDVQDYAAAGQCSRYVLLLLLSSNSIGPGGYCEIQVEINRHQPQ